MDTTVLVTVITAIGLVCSTLIAAIASIINVILSRQIHVLVNSNMTTIKAELEAANLQIVTLRKILGVENNK